MQPLSHSPQPPNPDAGSTDQITDQLTPVTAPAKSYQVVGLTGDVILIDFQGRSYDLANLSDTDLAYLRQYPDQVPYLA